MAMAVGVTFAGPVRRAAFGVLTLSTLVGCVPASHQSPAPLGVRIDDGVLGVVVPDCPGEGFTEASVTPIDAEVSLPEAWTGEGIVVDLDGSVALSPSDWTSVTGSYDGLEWFDVVLRGPKRSAATVVDDLDEVHGLPEGVYRVDDLKDMSMAEYREYLREEFPCP